MKHLSSLLITIASASLLSYQPGLKAVTLADGTVAFAQGPDLMRVATTFDQTRVWGAKYYFTIKVAENSDEPVGKLVIQQRQGSEIIKFTIQDTIAFQGEQHNRGKTIPLASVDFNPDNNSITIVFATPVSAGTVFTIGLFPRQNPDFGGVYLYGVTAYPAGEKAQGLYLGAGRLQFYDNNDSPLSIYHR